jgi:hypothetical protein
MSDQDVERFIAQFQSPAQALIAIAEVAGISIAYVDRVGFESQIERDLEDEEWEAVRAALAGTKLDEWLFDNDTEGLQGDFIKHVCEKAGVIPGEADVQDHPA